MCPPCQTRNRRGPDQSRTTFPDMGVYVCVLGGGVRGGLRCVSNFVCVDGGGIAVRECGWGGGGDCGA